MHEIDTSDFIIHRGLKSDSEEWLFDPKTSELYVWAKNPPEDKSFTVEKNGKYYLHENVILNHIPENSAEIFKFFREYTRKILIDRFGDSEKVDEFIPKASS
jgi:hypothetical protein